MTTTRQDILRSEKSAYWLPHIEAWQASHKTVKQYCQDTGENYDQFKYWQHQLAPHTKRWSRKPSQQRAETEAVSFVEVTTSSSELTAQQTTQDMTYELKHPSGLTVSVLISTPDDKLSQLLKLLSRLPC